MIIYDDGMIAMDLQRVDGHDNKRQVPALRGRDVAHGKDDYQRLITSLNFLWMHVAGWGVIYSGTNHARILCSGAWRLNEVKRLSVHDFVRACVCLCVCVVRVCVRETTC